MPTVAAPEWIRRLPRTDGAGMPRSPSYLPMKKALLTRELRECGTCGPGMTADPEAGVLRRVKLLGFDSANRRRYTEEAAASALGLYEGAKANIDHPDSPNLSRKVRDRFGKYENVELVSGDGVYGDLRFNPKHPMAEAVIWWAENQPDAIGLSHNAIGQGRDEEGIFVVERIVSVRSVDLVADPATTKGLREDRQVGMKLKAFFESAKWDKVHGPIVQKKLAKLFEDDYLDPETDVDGGEDGADHQTALKQGFDASCYAVIDDPDMSADEKVKRIKKLLKAHEKLSGDSPGGEMPDDEEDDEEDDEGDEGDEGDDEPMGESLDLARLVKSKNKTTRVLAEKLDRLETKDRLQERRAKAEKLCKEAKLPDAAVTQVFMESLLTAKDDKEMRRLVEDRRQVVFTKKPTSAGTASAVRGNQMDRESFRRQLKSNR